MNKLELIKSDFDDLNDILCKQYRNNYDCPIARAFKRSFPEYKNICVSSYFIWRCEPGEYYKDRIAYIKGDSNNVHRCRELLLSGEKAYIDIKFHTK